MKHHDIKSSINIIKTGDRDEVKIAQKDIESFWHNYYIPHREAGRKAFEVFLDEIKTFDQIKDTDHQSYFIYSLKWAFWTIGEEYFETWTEFVLKCLQHPSGKIRQAIIKTSDILILDICDRNIVYSGVTTAKDDTKMIRGLINLQRFGRFVMAVEDLLEQYYEPRYKRYKYISSMPVGIYKSLQIFITETILRSEYYENLYSEFLSNLHMSQLKSNQSN